jgi:XTP/dITP diphosphohydrolase
MVTKLLLATSNPGKVDEYRALLAGMNVTLVTPSDQGLVDQPEETGDTFEENALLKARYYALATGLMSLADDSGLEVDALGGEPGVHSARYAGEGATDADRVLLLLSKLEGVPSEKRAARFQCVVALAWPEGTTETFHGSCEGRIAAEPKGRNGFGYDPVFYVPELGKSFAELEPVVKNQRSHRAEAARKAADRLRGVIAAAKARA